MSNCLLQNEYGCVKCANNYYLTAKKDCKSYDFGCLEYFQAKCVTCSYKFQQIDGKCIIEGC